VLAAAPTNVHRKLIIELAARHRLPAVHTHCHFRGLLRLYSRYGPPDRSAARAIFVTRLQPLRLPARAARQLPDQSTTLRGGIFLQW
jgi:hypothetical protein